MKFHGISIAGHARNLDRWGTIGDGFAWLLDGASRVEVKESREVARYVERLGQAE